MEAQALLDALASLPSGAAVSAINSSGQFNVTFAVVTQQNPRRVTVNRASSANLIEALATGITVAMANLPE